MKKSKITGYNWEAARAYNKAKKQKTATPTPRASMNGNA